MQNRYASANNVDQASEGLYVSGLPRGIARRFGPTHQAAVLLQSPESEMWELGDEPLTVAMTVRLLGGFAVSVASREIADSAWALKKVKGLIKLLALAPDHQMHREQLMDLLWPELDPSAAANNLHKALHLARRALEPDLPPKHPSSYLRLHGDIVSLEASLGIDVEDFRGAAAAARLSRDPVLYEEALGLYAGDLLPEDRYEDWAASPREELRDLRFSLLLELAELWEGHNRIGAAVEALRLVVASDPVHEEAVGGLMRLLARAGQRHLALRHYQHLRDALQRELDAEPAPEIQDLFNRIRTGERLPDAVLVGAPSQESRDEELPLVGRGETLAECDALLSDLMHGCGGLVVIDGEAGAGKSRFSSVFAERAAARGVIVLSGAASREAGAPYAAFAVALDALASRLSPSDLRALLGASTQQLSELVPALRGGLGSPTGSTSPLDRRHLFGAVATLFRTLTQRAPVLLLIDDLDVADEATLELLRYLVRVSAHAPLLLAGTRTLGSSTSAAYLEVDGVARHVNLEPLDLGASSELVSSSLTGSVHPEVHEAIHAVARGNPAFTGEAVHAFVGRGYIVQREGCWHLLDGPRPLLNSLRLRASGAR